MTLTTDKKKKLIDQFKIHQQDSGSAPVQIAILTERINSLTDHFKKYPKDHHSRRGLLKLVSRRRKLLNYIKSRDIAKYQQLIDQLSLRK